MKLKELLVEGDFERYRKLGQNPLQLAKHVMGRGNSSTASTTPSTVTKKISASPESVEALDRVIAGEPLDSQHIQALKKLRKIL